MRTDRDSLQHGQEPFWQLNVPASSHVQYSAIQTAMSTSDSLVSHKPVRNRYVSSRILSNFSRREDSRRCFLRRLRSIWGDQSGSSSGLTNSSAWLIQVCLLVSLSLWVVDMGRGGKRTLTTWKPSSSLSTAVRLLRVRVRRGRGGTSSSSSSEMTMTSIGGLGASRSELGSTTLSSSPCCSCAGSDCVDSQSARVRGSLAPLRTELDVSSGISLHCRGGRDGSRSHAGIASTDCDRPGSDSAPSSPLLLVAEDIVD